MTKQYIPQFSDEDVNKIISSNDFNKLCQDFFSNNTNDVNSSVDPTGKKHLHVNADELFYNLLSSFLVTLPDVASSFIQITDERKEFLKDIQRFLVICIGTINKNIAVASESEMPVVEEVWNQALKSLN